MKATEITREVLYGMVSKEDVLDMFEELGYDDTIYAIEEMFYEIEREEVPENAEEILMKLEDTHAVEIINELNNEYGYLPKDMVDVYLGMLVLYSKAIVEPFVEEVWDELDEETAERLAMVG